MKSNNNIYPIGQQSFEMLRSRGALYVDKTQFVWKLVDSQAQYYFLGRPRRFGKSLFLDTIRCFFDGKRDLFNGLFINSVDWDWKQYPVLKLDLNLERYQNPHDLDVVLNRQFAIWEERYNVPVSVDNFAVRFADIIEAAHKCTGLPVVILVDEYDKPLVSNLNNQVVFDAYRSKLASIYSNFKSAAEHIRLVFLTGVSRFSKLSIFSDLNNIQDISFDNDFADICGISEAELHANFKQGISDMAEQSGVSYDEMSQRLKENYDGYRFALLGSDMYNPWSVLNAMSKRMIGFYWSQTGMPTLIADSLKRSDAKLEKSFNAYCTINELLGYDLSDTKPESLLYQAGYLTIKDYDPEIELIRLGIPNKEVKNDLYEILLPYYSNIKRGVASNVVKDMIKYFKLGSPDEAMRELQSFFAGVSYKLKMENENNFHNAFYLLTHLLGLNTQAEVTTSHGRIDMVIETQRYVYVIELKYDGSPSQALEQIKERNYARHYQTGARKVFLIGVNFSSATRCIESWEIESA